LELADLNGDGNPDLIDGARGFSGVQLNDGGGTFNRRSYDSPTWENTRDIAVGDVDRDGDIDFVEANYGRPNRLYLNSGTGTSFTVQEISANIANTSGIELADMNGDGLLDVIVANNSFWSNKLYINTGDPLVPFGVGGADGIALGFSPTQASRGVVVGDLDKDGDLDIVFLNEDLPNPRDGNREQRNRVFMNRLEQGFPNTFSESEIEIAGSNDIGLSLEGALGDMNADGFLDLIVCNIIDGQASQIYLNNGTAAANANPFTIAAIDFSVDPSSGEQITCQSISTADADKDGNLDIFLTSGSVDFRNRVYFNDGTGTSFTPVDVGPVGQAPLALPDPTDIGASSRAGAVGDVDNDGDIDWVVGNQASSSIPLENNLFRNTGADGASKLGEADSLAKLQYGWSRVSESDRLLGVR
jgi:hypothetical protein